MLIKIILSNFPKDKVKVNSYHNYSIKSCPINFKILYKTLDGNIEAMISKTKEFMDVCGILRGIGYLMKKTSKFSKQFLETVKYESSINKPSITNS